MFATLTHVGQAQYQQPAMESVHVNVHLDCLATLISGLDQTASNGVCTCKCPSRLSGNPHLKYRSECVLNSDCDRTLACASNKCVDPCPETCGSGAECRVINPSGNDFCGPYSNHQTIINAPASRDILVHHRTADQSVKSFLTVPKIWLTKSEVLRSLCFCLWIQCSMPSCES